MHTVTHGPFSLVNFYIHRNETLLATASQLSLAVPSRGRRNKYQQKLGRKQAHRAMHQLRIRSLAV